MNKQCPACGLINFSIAQACRRCQADLSEVAVESSARRVASRRRKYVKRLMLTPFIIFFLLLLAYASLHATSDPLARDERAAVERAIDILEARGFTSEVFMLRHVTAFRSTDNWFNRYVGHENAYAATNFPFQVVTLYPDFFSKPQDDTERATVLLHEAQHLYGADEEKAYEYVWRNRRRLDWTQEVYGTTIVWKNVVEATKNYAPRVFRCGLEQNQDCTD